MQFIGLLLRSKIEGIILGDQMNTIKILDCTLRDGGYCNQWEFGFDNIRRIINSLVDSNIEIIECGFLTSKVPYDNQTTKFNNISEIKQFIPSNKTKRMYVAMINYGEYDLDLLPDCDNSSIDGIRVAFHKKDINEAIEVCKKIKNKGYNVFIQAMVSLSYSDEEFLNLIKKVNSFAPYAFYIVDSFGMMKNSDLIRLFYLVENNLNKDICIGFHSHNNMQLAYSNAQTLVEIKTNRNIIIDSSIYGMGRGAGNLNTELFIEYLNENYEKTYQLKPLLTVIDEVLNSFYLKNYWGYSLPNYISAKHNAHPNYANFLDDKKTLTYEDMENIFSLMEEEKKYSYDKKYIEEIYIKYLSVNEAQETRRGELSNILKGRAVLIIAPGRSSIEEERKIISYIKEKNLITISVNYDCGYSDYIFVSNIRRYRELNPEKYKKCIITSNITSNEMYLQTKYKDLLNDVEFVKDNAGLMAIKFISEFKINEILLAGFDGYSHDANENYISGQVEYITKNAVYDATNSGMNKVLNEYSKNLKIKFLTTPKYLNV